MTENNDDAGMFCYSMDGEMYTSGYFATRADALAEAMDGAKPGQTIHIGVAVPVSPLQFDIDGDGVLERIGEHAYDLVGEAAEDWPDATREEAADLGERLTAVLHAWMDETGNGPEFFMVESVEKHLVPEPE